MIGNKLSIENFDSLFYEQTKKGLSWFVRGYVVLGLNTDTYNTLITGNKKVYYETHTTSSKETKFECYENSDFVNVVTASPKNVDMSFNVTPSFVLGITNISNISNIGNKIFESKNISADHPFSDEGGDVGLETPIYFKPNTKYIFKTISLEADNLMNFFAKFSEI